MTINMSRMMIRFGLLVLCVASISAAVAAQTKEADIRSLLNFESWSAVEIADLEKGEPVVQSLKTKDKQELATIGIVRIPTLPAVTIEMFRKSLNQKSDDAMRSRGRLGEPPLLSELEDLQLDDGTIAQLRKCSLRHCDLNLSANVIERLHTIDWDSPAAKQAATEVIREMLFSKAVEYSARGIDSLGTYDNRRKTIDVTASHRGLLQNATHLSYLAPEFHNYLAGYPREALANVENSLHWSVVDLGPKPSITLSHVSAYSQIRNGTRQFFVASRQIYSSRYLDCSLSLAMLLPVVEENSTSTYLLFIDRSRSDALDGPLGGLARSVAKKEVSDKIRKMLDQAHIRLLVLTAPPPKEAEADEDPGFFTWPVVAFLIVAPALAIAIGFRKFRSARRPFVTS